MKDQKPAYQITQLIVSFVIPLIILTRFSSESQLGATKGFLVALAFPAAFELYNVLKNKKISIFSLFAIGGIIATGIVGVFELSEGWLAVRRSAVFFAASVIIMVSVWIKKPVVNALMPHVFDMKLIESSAKERKTWHKFNRNLRRTSYLLSGLLLLLAIASFVLTLVVIKSPAGTTGFNDEYAHLRVLSLPIITAPFLLGAIAIVFYLLNQTEKLTGIDPERLLKNRRQKSARKK